MAHGTKSHNQPKVVTNSRPIVTIQVMIQVRKIEVINQLLQQSLVGLLNDAVSDGASIGFLAPLPVDVAAAYWQSVGDALGNNLHLWIAESENQVVGTIQLERCAKENGRHRGEIQKLFVSQSKRGGGISTLLMREAERYAAQNGLSLLVLDTQAGSKAEHVYRHLGWHRVGEIPDYATSPEGKLLPTVYFFKQISSAEHLTETIQDSIGICDGGDSNKRKTPS